jgi:hypothetical protein
LFLVSCSGVLDAGAERSGTEPLLAQNRLSMSEARVERAFAVENRRELQLTTGPKMVSGYPTSIPRHSSFLDISPSPAALSVFLDIVGYQMNNSRLFRVYS